MLAPASNATPGPAAPSLPAPGTRASDLAGRLSALADTLGPALGPRLQRDVPLAPLTTFRIGGPADLLAEVRSADELALAVTAARAAGVPFFLLGLGANILVGDGGFRGLVILNRAAGIAIDAEAGVVRAESGAVVWPDLVEATIAAGLSGLEHYAGIPSSVGGALWQNLHFLAPAPLRERTMFIEEVVEGADLLTAEGERRAVDRAYFDFGYDYSTLHVRPDIVLEASFRLAPAPEADLRRVVAENLAWRAERHPPLGTEPSAGSIFKKIDGVGAGRLIDWCGLKGARIGGAEVSHRHANIVVNRGGATARDVRHLIGYVQRTVAREQGYRLSPEIGFVGDFGPLPDLPPRGWEDADGFAGGVPPGGHPEAHRDARGR